MQAKVVEFKANPLAQVLQLKTELLIAPFKQLVALVGTAMQKPLVLR